ncbi:hypothetical protein [Lysinibacillus macroides]|nr:hypothetical protein [Lysinibacillus macroides]
MSTLRHAAATVFRQPMNQPSYTRVDEDPFANSKAPIEVMDEDLPF